MLLKVKILLKGGPKNQLIGKNIYVYIYVTELLRYVGMPSQCRLLVERFYNTTCQGSHYLSILPLGTF